MSMAAQRDLRTYLRRTIEGGYRLEAEDGSLVVESNNYRDLRKDLEVLLSAMPAPPLKVKVLIGSPRRPALRAVAPADAAA
jgi:hypothetical protein